MHLTEQIGFGSFVSFPHNFGCNKFPVSLLLLWILMLSIYYNSLFGNTLQ